MRRLSLRVGLSVFASATLLGGGAAASAIELAPEEQCQLSSVLSSQDDESSQDAVLSSQDTMATQCGAVSAPETSEEAAKNLPVVGATMFGGISLALVSASAAFAGIDWTPILIKLGSLF
ncbi:hypothetical protein [Corynebacterium sp. HMSC074H12]|uniref:hypothetical protein n=1 Tax=Corynebacterium sp. HMSC074H12 TaxID=1739436 RepID=UPI0008BF4B0E|nr:hypothetical protein [Corynebacterium sp. HMSC074H12]OFQ58428.1 hypothetical protein HMPREF2932_01365 [Corynebacterium sp. HMSC074H12]